MRWITLIGCYTGKPPTPSPHNYLNIPRPLKSPPPQKGSSVASSRGGFSYIDIVQIQFYNLPSSFTAYRETVMTMFVVLCIVLWLALITSSVTLHHLTLNPGIRAAQQRQSKVIAKVLRFGESTLMSLSACLWTLLTLGQVVLTDYGYSILADTRSSLIGAYVVTYLLLALLSWKAVTHHRRNEDAT